MVKKKLQNLRLCQALQWLITTHFLFCSLATSAMMLWEYSASGKWSRLESAWPTAVDSEVLSLSRGVKQTERMQTWMGSLFLPLSYSHSAIWGSLATACMWMWSQSERMQLSKQSHIKNPHLIHVALSFCAFQCLQEKGYTDKTAKCLLWNLWRRNECVCWFIWSQVSTEKALKGIRAAQYSL